MIPGSTNGQVWQAKTIKKIEPVARTTKIYPIEVTEGITVAPVVVSFAKGGGAVNLNNPDDALSCTASITWFLLQDSLLQTEDALSVTASITFFRLQELLVTTEDALQCAASITGYRESEFYLEPVEALAVDASITGFTLV